MSIRKPAPSGKGANTPTHSTPATTTEAPRMWLDETIARLTAQLDDPSGYSVQAFMPLHEAIGKRLQRSANHASEQASKLERAALSRIEDDISVALVRLNAATDLLAEFLGDMSVDEGAERVHFLLCSIYDQAEAITKASHAIAAVRMGEQA